MKNKFSKFAAAAGSFALAASMFAPMATMAATNYTPVAGTSCPFNKYLIMDAGDTVPNATFSFTVAPGQPISADTSDNATMEVMAGVGTPTIANVTFSPSDTTDTSTTGLIDIGRTNVQRGGSAGDTVQFDSGEKFATKQATVDFSSVTFNEPGIYRYIITETADADHAAAGIIHDTDVDRVLDVYVIDDGTGTLEVESYVIHTDVNNPAINATMGSADVQTALAAVADKTDGFTNEYASKDLKIEKEVTGNQASRDKYFALTVTCDNIADEDSYVVSIADDSVESTNDGNADAQSGAAKIGGTIAANAGQTNPQTVLGEDLKAGVTFYLQHGQSVVIRGLAPNATYYVTENAEDYASAVKAGDTNGTSAAPAVLGTVAGANKMATAGFTNTREGIVPTGVVLYVGLGIALIALGAGGFVLVSRKRREED